ncbi:MAG: purine phosphoribosyltransferase family protein, partial [Methanomicrobium sp.]|nr:purine phosphoribosyltransferase family protein [Methanomicrobium sp.]
MFDKLVKSLETCPIVKRGEYNYFIHPISDGVPIVEPELLREVAVLMLRNLNLEGVTKIVVAEAMGIHIGVALSMMTDIPLTIIRKREYKLPGEIALHQTTGYSKGELYLNSIKKGEKVVVVDDVFSTGGTMKAILSGL